jgi:hypothetical protein
MSKSPQLQHSIRGTRSCLVIVNSAHSKSRALALDAPREQRQYIISVRLSEPCFLIGKYCTIPVMYVVNCPGDGPFFHMIQCTHIYISRHSRVILWRFFSLTISKDGLSLPSGKSLFTVGRWMDNMLPWHGSWNFFEYPKHRSDFPPNTPQVTTVLET